MSSIMTNSAAMTALQTLQNINKNLETTQSRISTGFRVATAADNAAYWSIATTMRSDSTALSAVDDALGLGAATVDVAYTALESTIDVMDEIKSKLVAASTPGVDRGKIQTEIDELLNTLQSTADAAVFNEQNWLSVDSGATGYSDTRSIVSSFTRAGGAISVGTVEVSIDDVKLFDTTGSGTALATPPTPGATPQRTDEGGILDSTWTIETTYDADNDSTTADAATTNTLKIADLDISALTDQAADLGKLGAYIKVVDHAIGEMTDAATTLGAVKTRVDMQSEFVSNLMDVIDRGVGQLVDADMNEESTRLQALQTQQQLGIQALSIANSNSQSILSLFR